VTLAVANADVVLPDRVLRRGAVLVRDGEIAAVVESASDLPLASAEVVDAQGSYLFPGLIDLHNDGLEVEVNPRPRANLPLPFAFAAMERRLLAAGVTTELHAVSFMDRAAAQRTATGAIGRAEYIVDLQRRRSGGVDHQVLHRIDVWSPEHLDAIFESVARVALRYVSINDHTPGQGQYPDLRQHVERMREYARLRGAPPPTAESVYERAATRAADGETVPVVYARIEREARRLGMVVATHDDDSPQKVDAQRAIGATVAEFPVTFPAAERARELGMTIVVGAPNVVRGGSQSGNLDARELFRRGLADVICADYHAPSLLAAVFRLVEEGLRDLPAAVRTVTLQAARAVGLSDRGALVAGMRADLVLARLDAEGVPVVEAVYRGGRPVYSCAVEVAA
jgi:alpha-D-ribose 1-methylphosphonate 5-triphosphate diphosphatase